MLRDLVCLFIEFCDTTKVANTIMTLRWQMIYIDDKIGRRIDD